MRRWFSLVLLLAACGDDGVGLFADTQWQVRCPPALAGCSRDGENVDVFASEGDEGVNISCEVDESGDLRFVSFNVSQGGHRLQVTGLQTGLNGGAVTGTGCRVTVVDDSTTYEGACGSSAPSVSQPCQITGLSFIEDRVGDTDSGRFGPEVVMSMTCQGVTAAADPVRFQRDVYRSRTSGTTPANIRLINCNGL
ncbi:MAG: hypothetical protein KC586_11860 [Myxococcales bacterium]|nr:hypothetical protein [Myxococcales bacterium]